MMKQRLKPDDDGVAQLACKVMPNARKSECAGWGSGERGRAVLLVRLAASEVEGKANKESIRFVAELLGCAKSAVSLVRGETSRTKVVSVPTALATRLREGSGA